MFVKDIEGNWGTTLISSLFSVKGKTVVVTGGARGIGLMIALGFVENGANVILISRKPDPEAAAALEKHVLVSIMNIFEGSRTMLFFRSRFIQRI